jgi:hypothetical protein
VGTHDDQPIWRERAVAWVEKSCTERVPVKLSDPLPSLRIAAILISRDG